MKMASLLTHAPDTVGSWLSARFVFRIARGSGGLESSVSASEASREPLSRLTLSRPDGVSGLVRRSASRPAERCLEWIAMHASCG